MDPVLQHLGDVTIERLEKPKPKQDVPNEPVPQDKVEEETNQEELQTLKRSSSDSAAEVLPKKIRIGSSEISITEKTKTNSTTSQTPQLPSDEELSDYESESEFESEGEESEVASIKKEPVDLKEPEVETDPSFLEDLVDNSFLNKTPPVTIKTEVDTGDTEDYEYDIKEKLKEMGEISFETVKKGDKPKKIETVENEVTVTPAKKSGEEDGMERKGPMSSSMLRRNIREVMDEAKLDESTLAAQRQEAERLKRVQERVQEQQRIIREVQRQVAQEKMQNKVFSLLQGGNLTKPGTSGTRIGNTVLVKLPNGETKPMTKIGKRPFELLKVQKNASGPLKPPKSILSPMRPSSQGQLTPSVSIAPVMKRPTQFSRPPSDSDSESEEYKYQKLLSKARPAKESHAVAATIDLSSDDDCVVVSETEADTGNDDEMIEDPANSGMHTNDEFNQPDEQGRVVINIGHPDSEPDVYVAPQIARIIKPHQIGGVRFLYDNVVESLNRFQNSTGFGCILAHSMGLGKTLQVVCFSDIFLRHTAARTILCIMPINTLQNWLAEFNMWLPTEDDASSSPLHVYGDVRPRNFNLHVLNDSHKTLIARSKVIHAWRTDGGVLLIGYEQYRLLSLRKQPKSRRKPHLIEPEDEDKNRKLFDDIHSALVMPGPDLVICDEGHRIKNSHASISQALKQMRTKRRVVLTGYPLQNNLMEYWCMVDFVRPNYLGSKTEFCNMFERPIQNGQCIDSTETDIKLMRYRAHVLHSLLVGFVQRRSHEVLQTALPQKEEYVLLLRMSLFQRKLYNTFMNEVVRVQAVPNPLKAFAVCCKIWNHPDVLYHFLKKRAGGEAVDIDLEEVSSNSTTDTPGKPKRNNKKATTPKGKKGAKPAASVTPYNSSTIADPSANQIKPPTTITQQSSNSLEAQFSPSSDANVMPPQTVTSTPSSVSSNNFNTQCFNQQTFLSQNKPSTCTTSFSQNQNFPDSQKLFSQTSNFIQNNQHFSPQSSNTNSFSNFAQQNYWGSKEPNDFYGNFKTSFNQNSLSDDMFASGNSCDNSQMAQWIKKDEDGKPVMTNVINPMKAEGNNSFGSSENKPKINIISDIKIGSPFSNPLNKTPSDSKKINIISDIKLDIKKEESNDDKSFPRFPFDSIKNEIKPPIHNFGRTLPDDEDVKIISDMPPPAKIKEEAQDGIPYDWAVELLRDYIPGCIENSGKMEVLFCIIRESISLGDRLLLFSQSLITLDLVEQFLQTNEVPGETEKWCKNVNYYRLDGSTSALEREKLINEFNSNPKIHLFLVSTRAGSLGINLVGANRVVVLDASWNPCHDTQAVCRVYRYGQRKPCFVYRLVMDHCLEKKIYDRQINKQGMSDRVVDECNPDAHLTMKDVSTLCFDDSEEGELKDWGHVKDRYIDIVLQRVLELYGDRLNKPPFQHESLLVDRKDKQLSQQEKRLAKKSYEREKQAARQPAYSLAAAARSHRPIASVRPMQQGGERPTRWIPAEHWQRQGMTAQEMTLPLDVVIPTNQPDKSNIILKAGQKVLVLKSPKGVYMQLENGKIVAIKTAIKVRGKAEDEVDKVMKPSFPPILKPPGMPLMPPKRMVRPFSPGVAKLNMRSVRQAVPNLISRMQSTSRKVQMAKTRPYHHIGSEMAQSMSQPKLDERHLLSKSEELSRNKNITQQKTNSLPTEVAQRLLSDEITMEPYSPKADKGGNQKVQSKIESLPSNAMLKNAQRSVPNQKPRGRSPSSTIQQLEQSTSAIISQTKQRIQDISDISNSYQEDEKLQSSSETSSLAPLDSDHLQDLDTPDEVEDLDQHYQDEPSNLPPANSTNTPLPIPPESIKTDIPNQDYNYNGYFGYNMQPYPPPPPQAYSNYPPQPPPYEYNYPPPHPPQQPQYNYPMYPQAYPPQPQYPPPPQAPPYDYGPPPPQPPPPMYSGYHSPYPQQYSQPPPPPANPYPPVGPPPTYPEYQYNAAPPPQNPPTNTAPYFPNS